MTIPKEPNVFVRLKNNPSQVGVTTGQLRPKKDGLQLQVNMAGKGKGWYPESQIELVPDNPNPSEEVLNGKFSDPDALRRLLIHIRLTGRLADMIYSMKATNTEFHPYQFKPVVKIINSPSHALLIADEVGLGKTIEAGLIWTELKARFRAKNLLILCLKSLTLKWHDELKNKFNVRANIMDAKQLNAFLNTPLEWHEDNAIICSIDSIRPDKGWDGKDYASNKIEQQKLSEKLNELSANEPIFDLLVVDEAHRLKDPKNETHKLAARLRSISDHCVFLSATPIHLKNRDLFALLKLLDPGAFINETDFEALIKSNNPIIAAREAVLHQADATEAKAHVGKSLENSLLKDSESLQQINEELKTFNGDIDYDKRAELAARLDSVNLLANLVTRTRRRDVEELRINRRVEAKKINMSQVERRFYDLVGEAVTEYAHDEHINQRFLLSHPQRIMTSSMPAALSHWRQETHTGADMGLDEAEDDIDEDKSPQDGKPLISYLREATSSIDSDDLIAHDTKYSALKDFLKKNDSAREKKIIFSAFKPSLAYLKQRLKADGFNPVMIHGSVKDRNGVLDKFKSDPEVDILLSSEIGSEGLDLQFCKILVNYDLPWNPMRVEQRIGRVDRLGQESKYVDIVNFIYDETIDQRIWDRLYARLRLCEQALGGFEEILGDEIGGLERDILTGSLTKEEEDKRVKQTATALANKRKIQEELEKEAAGLIAHGDYILNKVRSAHEFNRWLTPEDMMAYLKAFFNEHYPRSKILVERLPSKPHKLTLDTQLRQDLRKFIYEKKLRVTNRSLLEKSNSMVFFGKLTAPITSSVDNITQHHPLMRFATQLVADKTGGDFAPAITAKIKASDIKKPKFNPGIYIIAIQRWSITGLTTIEKLAYSGWDENKQTYLTGEDAEILTTAILMHGEKNLRNYRESTCQDFSKIVDNLFEKLHEQFENFYTQHELSLTDRANFQLRSLERHFATREETIKGVIEKQKLAISNKKTAIRLNEDKLKKLYERIAERKQKIDKAKQCNPTQKDVSTLILEII